MKPAYITDLDHTFLRSDLTLSRFSIDTWNRIALEATISIATARSYKKVMQFLGSLHLNAPLVLLDGALVVTAEKKVIDLKLIDRETGDAVIHEAGKFGIYPVIISLEDDDLNEAFVYPTILNHHQELLVERYLNDDNLMQQTVSRARAQNLKIVYMGEEALLRDLHTHLQKIFGEQLKMILGPEAYLGCYYLTLLHPMADKAHGLVSASHFVNHDVSEMTVFGDSTNDLGMFKLSGRAIAVQNAIEAVKAVADIVLPHTNDEDAVAHFLSEQRKGTP
jgi:Cof subfamily protein (haloacid dehalogenase superfamily)